MFGLGLLLPGLGRSIYLSADVDHYLDQGVEDKEASDFYLGKRIAYIYKVSKAGSGVHAESVRGGSADVARWFGGSYNMYTTLQCSGSS